MITTSNKFIYTDKPILPHNIHIQPYSPQQQTQPLPQQCSCGFYHNMYNMVNGNSFLCCYCGSSNQFNQNDQTNEITTPLTQTVFVQEQSFEKHFLFLISLQLQPSVFNQLIKPTFSQITQKGY